MERLGRATCSLCSLFNTDQHTHETACRGCPVFNKTGIIYCQETPYINQGSLYYDGPDYDASEALMDNGQEWVDACQAEIDFLKSLLE